MPSLSLGTDAIGHFELAMIGPDGVDVWCFGYQPTTDDIAERHLAGKHKYSHCVQRIGNQFEVYDLKTLRMMGRSSMYTIGLPIYTGPDPDAAIMAALLLSE